MPKERHPFSPMLKEDFVTLLRKGKLRFEACRQLEVTPTQVQYAYRNDPDFRADVDSALLEATEPIEGALYQAALAGEPWAVQKWLQHRDKERWGPQEQKITVTHELDGTALRESVAELAAQLETRRMHALAIETGGKMIEPIREKQPYIYEPGQAPVFHSIATSQGQKFLKKRAEKTAQKEKDATD